MTNVELKIVQRYNTFNPTEKKIADFFLANVDRVFHLPIAQLAGASGVSQAAWVRFAQSLGYEGLKSLKRSLFDAFNTTAEETAGFTDIKDFTDLDTLCRAIRQNSVQAIEDTSQALDVGVLDTVVQRMLEAGAVRLFGVGASATVAEDFCSKLMRIGMRVIFHHDTHLQLSYAANASHGDVALLISHNGATREILEMHALAKAAGALTISLTRLESNPLCQRTDLQLYTRSPEIYYRSGAMSSRLAQLFVIDVLYTSIANRNYEQVVTHLQRSSKGMQSHRIALEEASEVDVSDVSPRPSAR